MYRYMYVWAFLSFNSFNVLLYTKQKKNDVLTPTNEETKRLLCYKIVPKDFLKRRADDKRIRFLGQVEGEGG